MLPYLKFFWLFACVTKASKISVISSPGNMVRDLEVCNNQLPEDAVADFLAMQGIHDNGLIPIQYEYIHLMEWLCEKIYEETPHSNWMETSCSSLLTQGAQSYPQPSPFLNPENAFVTLYFYDKAHMLEPGQLEPFGIPVYLRVGYSHADHAACACSKVSCSPEEYEAVDTYLRGVLQEIVSVP